uniref:Ig-like domain-containing protein n=1 Tax=Poecilia reticulata TaxID=8081 RepID=A0A3P9Q014_POERE
MQLPKETPITVDLKHQKALVQKEDRWNVMHVTSVADSHAKFDCETEDAPNVTFKWYKSNIEIKQSEKYRIISRHTGSSLELLNPVKADSGEYTCKASNQHGSDSCTASLIMYPPVFVSKPEPMTLFVGKQAVLQCSLTGSSPMEVVWHKDNIAIASEGNYVIKSEKNKYSLHIKSLELTDQGVYLCKASNSVGTATFTTELTVIRKPSFVRTFEPTSALLLMCCNVVLCFAFCLCFFLLMFFCVCFDNVFKSQCLQTLFQNPLLLSGKWNLSLPGSRVQLHVYNAALKDHLNFTSTGSGMTESLVMERNIKSPLRTELHLWKY